MLGLALLLLGITVLHDVDHVVNEAELTDLSWTFWALIVPLQYAGYGLFLWVIGRGGERAAQAATILGFGAVAAFTVVHVLPFGPAPFADYDAPFLSWALVAAGSVAGLALGLAGLSRLRGRLSTA